MERTCNVCKATLPASAFYKGVTSRCRECHKTKARENRAANVEYYRAYDAARFQNDSRVKERHRRYQATEDGKLSLQKTRKKWLAENPVKRAAHIILGNAVQRGKICKPKTCQVCGSGGKMHGHHDDYAKPLDVIWCCPTCHTEIHRKLEGDKHE